MKNTKKPEDVVADEPKVEKPSAHRVVATFDPVYLIDQGVWVSPGEARELRDSNDLLSAIAAGKLKHVDAD